VVRCSRHAYWRDAISRQGYEQLIDEIQNTLEKNPPLIEVGGGFFIGCAEVISSTEKLGILS